MSTVDKDQTIAGWEYVLEHGRLTLSPGMTELIQVTLSTLKEGSHPQSRKALNTWTVMLTKGKVLPAMRKQVQDTVLLLMRAR